MRAASAAALAVGMDCERSARMASTSACSTATLRRWADHKHDLALDVIDLGVMRGEFGQRASAELLEGLGQFAADGCLSIAAEHVCRGNQGGADAVRGFEEHQRCGGCCKFRQAVAAGLVLGRQKAGEQEGVVGQAGTDKGCQRRRGAGNGDDTVAGLDRRLRQTVAGIGDQRSPGIGDQRHGLALFECREQPWASLVGIVFVVGVGAVLDAVAIEQDAGDAGVLAGEHIGASQGFQRAQGNIAEISDRRGDEIEPRLLRAGGNRHVVQAEAALPAAIGCRVVILQDMCALSGFRPLWASPCSSARGRTSARAAISVSICSEIANCRGARLRASCIRSLNSAILPVHSSGPRFWAKAFQGRGVRARAVTVESGSIPCVLLLSGPTF
jgi:hypothetical protein